MVDPILSKGYLVGVLFLMRTYSKLTNKLAEVSFQKLSDVRVKSTINREGLGENLAVL